MARIEVPEGDGSEEVCVFAHRPEMGLGAAALAKAVYEDSILEPRVRECARMRIAQINDCPI